MNKKETIHINHCVYAFNTLTVPRSNWNFKTKNIKDSDWKYVPLPLRFRNLLHDKQTKWQKEIIEFTVGHAPEAGIWALAIVHPKDNFCKKIGRKIVEGRIKRVIENKKPYKEYPRTIYILTREGMD